MARQPKPWFWKARNAWFVTIDGQRHNLGADKKLAQEQFFQLMRQPKQGRMAPQDLAAIIDTFLDWVQKNRAPDTYEWYRYRLQRFVEANPNLRAVDLRPFHVQQWVDGYPQFGATSRRNYLRSIRRCCSWALKQGYLENDPLTHLEIPAAERKDILITADEFAAIISFCRHQTFADLVTTTWEIGCRPQELLRVESRHVDLENCRWVFPRPEATRQA